MRGTYCKLVLLTTLSGVFPETGPVSTTVHRLQYNNMIPLSRARTAVGHLGCAHRRPVSASLCSTENVFFHTLFISKLFSAGGVGELTRPCAFLQRFFGHHGLGGVCRSGQS